MARAAHKRQAMPPVGRGEIAVVGVGPTLDLRHMTREAYGFLAKVGASTDPDLRVYSLDAVPVLAHPVLRRARQAGLCRDLRPFYELRPAKPWATYEAVARLLVRRVLGHRLRVVFVLMGNPMLWALPALLVRRECAAHSVPVRLFVSPSFVDLALEHMDTTGLEGLTLALASWVVKDRPRLVPEASYLIGQLTDGTGVLADRYTASGLPALKALQEKLLSVYPPDHRVVLIFAGGKDAAMESRHIRVDELTQNEDAGLWSNVWIPPLTPKLP